MNTKNALKRTAAFLSAFLCSAFMFTGVSRAGAESERTINTVNYGTEDNMIFADKGFVIFSVTDENGNPLDEGDFILTDSEGGRIVSWRGNELTQMGISSQSSASSVDSKSRVYVYGEQIPDFSEGKGYTRSTSVKTGEKSSALIYPDGAGAFVYGQTFEATSRYVIYGETELTVPAHSFGTYSDAAWASRTVPWHFTIGEYKDPEDDFSDMINLYEFSFNNFAGKLNVQQFADGKYPYRMGYNGGSSGNVHQRITISDKVYEYAKKTINLHEKFPTYFNEDGTHDMDVFGTQRNFSFAEDSTSTKQTAGICFLSGNLITAPIPDKNGNVTIYVNKEDYSFTLMTDFGWESGGGGGITGVGGYADSKAVFSFSTPSVPENGFALKKLPVGEYTVKSVDLPEKYEAYSGAFTISNEPGSGVPECRIVTEIKKRAVNIAESKYGTVKVNADDTSKIPAESVVKFEAVPEEGYRTTGLKCTDENGNDVEISDDNTFTMPYTSVAVEASFAEIVKGDVNGDGKINAQDILWEVNMITGYTEAPDKGWTDAADINGDGQLNIFDYIRLIKKITAF